MTLLRCFGAMDMGLLKRWGAAVFLITLGASACQRGGSGNKGVTPEGAIQGYISDSFNVHSVTDKEKLLEHLTGAAKTRLAAWSETQFREAFVDAKREFVRLAFKEVKKLAAEEATVTYELTFLDKAKGAKGNKVTQKKLGRVVRESDRWKISEVQNLKELIEYQDELSLP